MRYINITFIAVILVSIGIGSVARASESIKGAGNEPKSSRIETFTFSSQGKPTKGKIYIPASYKTNNNLPAIFLIDFTEQHFKIATDEFEKVIEGVEQIQGFDALVVTLEKHLEIDAEPQSFNEHYNIFKDMSAYVDSKYTNNTSRTLIGKGSEAGIVLMALFLDDSKQAVFDNYIATDPSGHYGSALINLLENEGLSIKRRNTKLHFSFSTSNDHAMCSRIIKLIKEAQFPWLKFESREYKESNYENTYPLSFAEGISFVYDK